MSGASTSATKLFVSGETGLAQFLLEKYEKGVPRSFGQIQTGSGTWTKFL